MKVLLLTNEFPPHVYGGAGVHVEYLARELARLVDVEVRRFGESAAPRGRLAVRGYGTCPGRFDRTAQGLRSPLGAFDRGVALAADPVDADVVHAHTWYALLGALLVKRAYGVPLVVTAHSLEPLRPWKREQLGRGYDLSTWIEKTALEDADAVVAVSEGMKQDIETLFDVDPRRVHVIHNGIDTREYRPVTGRERLPPLGVDPARPYVLFVGRVTRQKGIIHLVDAIPQLVPDVQVVLCAGAPDTPEIAREMDERVRAVQAARAGVVWIDRTVDRRTAVQLYAHAAVFCCPSVYEPFGIINLEALACATPVVASAVGGIPEIVEPGRTGLLVPVEPAPDDGFRPKDAAGFSAALAAALNELLSDPERARAMGEAGRKRAVERFGWAGVARRTARLYGELAGGGLAAAAGGAG